MKVKHKRRIRKSPQEFKARINALDLPQWSRSSVAAGPVFRHEVEQSMNRKKVRVTTEKIPGWGEVSRNCTTTHQTPLISTDHQITSKIERDVLKAANAIKISQGNLISDKSKYEKHLEICERNDYE